MESEISNSQAEPDKSSQNSLQTVTAPSENGRSVLVEPDLKFILRIAQQSGDFYKKCIQCGTCSATCPLSPDRHPFPRKEIAWAVWGMKKQLMQDPDVWLCYQCNDCSERCPRGARPGEVMGAIRQECVRNFSFPMFLGKWVNSPPFIPLLLAIPIILLTLAMYLKYPLEALFGIIPSTGGRIVYSYSSMFPHWLLISFFLFFSVLSFIILLSGGLRFWSAIKTGTTWGGVSQPKKKLYPSILTSLKNVFVHHNFNECTKSSNRFWPHIGVFFGFIGLSLVAIWIITNGINPLLNKDFVYPFSFWNPWKVLANTGGLVVLACLLLMVKARFTDNEHVGSGGYFDWVLLSTLLLILITGFATEALHYVRLEPHRHLIYFAHLTMVLAMILYLPYSKLAHIVYRFVAMVYAEYTGRNDELISDREAAKSINIAETAVETENAPV